MIWVRRVGLWVLGVAWLAVGAGYIHAAEGGEKPDEAETVVIPLDKIWASNVPGTRDIQGLDWKQLRNPQCSLRSGSLDFLGLLGKEKAEPGFVVPGEGQDALIAAHAKLPTGEKPSDTLPFGTEISVVYFSHAFARYIRLHHVERHRNRIDVWYRFNDTGVDSLSEQLALIPLGKLPVGKYRVNMIEMSPEKNQGHQPSFLAKVHLAVCQSFSFSIKDAKSKVGNSTQ